jgi:hypothetical protein
VQALSPLCVPPTVSILMVKSLFLSPMLQAMLWQQQQQQQQQLRSCVRKTQLRHVSMHDIVCTCAAVWL